MVEVPHPQNGSKILVAAIFGNGDRFDLSCYWPMKNGFNLSNLWQHHDVLQYFDVLGVLDRLFVALRFECGIASPLLKEVIKGRTKVNTNLLQAL